MLFLPLYFLFELDKDLFSLYQTTLFGPYFTGLCIYPYFVNIACILYMNWMKIVFVHVHTLIHTLKPYGVHMYN